MKKNFFNAVFHNTVTVTIFTKIDDDNYILRGLKILKSPTAHYGLFRAGTADYSGLSFIQVSHSTHFMLMKKNCLKLLSHNVQNKYLDFNY
jgi:hypothetical protein